MITVRTATEEDRKAIFLLSLDMHRSTDFVHYDFDPEKAFVGLGAWLGLMPSKVMFVAEKDGNVIGMLAATVISTWFGHEKTAGEELFYVAKEHRGSRAAFLMMRRFCQWAKEIQADHLRAGVATGGGPAAERLYSHFGMTYVGGNFSSHLNLNQ